TETSCCSTAHGGSCCASLHRAGPWRPGRCHPPRSGPSRGRRPRSTPQIQRHAPKTRNRRSRVLVAAAEHPAALPRLQRRDLAGAVAGRPAARKCPECVHAGPNIAQRRRRERAERRDRRERR
ncbi:hypothetical protein HK405_014163, partial [Cladochytrium tenue]